MNVQSKYSTTPDEFLRWNEGREVRREFVRGKAVEMTVNATRNHVWIATNLVLALGKRLDLAAYDMGSADFGVRTPDGIRYPDVYIDRRTPAASGRDLPAVEPVFLADVLSPSSVGRDFVDKLTDYQALASLQHYLILSHETPQAWLWDRRPDGSWAGPSEFASDRLIDLAHLGISIGLAEIYANVEWLPN
jgi:Uma2 family endonuclease